jgi:hypothetical protein
LSRHESRYPLDETWITVNGVDKTHLQPAEDPTEWNKGGAQLHEVHEPKHAVTQTTPQVLRNKTDLLYYTVSTRQKLSYMNFISQTILAETQLKTKWHKCDNSHLLYMASTKLPFHRYAHTYYSPWWTLKLLFHWICTLRIENVLEIQLDRISDSAI